MLYGAAAKSWRAMGGLRMVTYTRSDEPGTSLKAAGWINTATRAAGSWNCPSRERAQQELIPKLRWEPYWSVLNAEALH